MSKKRKINATDEELMPPPQKPISKKSKQSKLASLSHSGISDISNTSNISNRSHITSQSLCGPLSIFFEKAQGNTNVHNKYFNELTQIYEKVSLLFNVNSMLTR